VGKERVPVRLEREVKDVGEMGVIDVGKDAEELFVNVFRRAGERGRKVSAFRRGAASMVREWGLASWIRFAGMEGQPVDSPLLVGKTPSSSISLWTQLIT